MATWGIYLELECCICLATCLKRICIHRHLNGKPLILLTGRKYGYVKYADAESARMAIECLHGQTICGNYLKVILADPPKSDHSGKRERGSSDYQVVDDDSYDRSKMAKVD